MKALCVLLLLAASAPALAHAHLEKSAPTANARVKAPGRVVLNFSETLEPIFSGASISDAAGKDVPAAKSVGGSTITLLPMALKPGTYSVAWHSVGQDTHRLSGSFHFTVIP